jgi:hypothetical protein
MMPMKILESERYGMIRLFEACISALALLVQRDAVLFGWRRSRVAMCHRLAHYLEHAIFPTGSNDGFVFDLSAPVGLSKGSVTSDILLHNRNLEDPVRPMAIMCRDDYLSEQELRMLYDLKTESGCTLALAIAFLPQKSYLLIYRADDEWIDYYHFDRDDHHCHLLRRRDMENLADNGQQLKLGIKVPR